MANSVGNLLLPVQVPAEETDSVGDPALDVLAEFFAAVLRADLTAAWEARSDEPLIKNVSKHDPEETDFCVSDMPLLACWRGDDTSPARSMDEINEVEANFQLLWVPQPSAYEVQATRHSFFSAFDHSIAHAVLVGRHPAWKLASELASATQSVVDEAEAYGSSVLTAAGLSMWTLRNVRRVPVDIPIDGTRAQTYNGYLATIQATEWTVVDPSAYGTSATVIHGDVVSQDKQVIRGQFREPV